jgi:hypothetical protein
VRSQTEESACRVRSEQSSMYRTAPLAGLWTHQKGGFYHDGRPLMARLVRRGVVAGSYPYIRSDKQAQEA